jgi:hypothetical protein
VAPPARALADAPIAEGVFVVLAQTTDKSALVQVRTARCGATRGAGDGASPAAPAACG